MTSIIRIMKLEISINEITAEKDSSFLAVTHLKLKSALVLSICDYRNKLFVLRFHLISIYTSY